MSRSHRGRDARSPSASTHRFADLFARTLLGLVAGSVLAAGTPAAAREGDEVPGDRSKAAGGQPAILGEGDSAWAYLSGKYDANADGTISATEYDRGAEAYGRLDRNQDGVVDASDFASPGGGGMGRGGMRSRMAPLTLLRLFQADDDEESLRREEIAVSFSSFDTNGDGRIDESEFQEAAKDRASGMIAMMGGFRFEPLYDEADDDEDGALSLEELEDYFDWRDSDGDGIWTMRRSREDRGGGPGRGSGTGRSGAGEAGNGPHGNGAQGDGGEESLDAADRDAPAAAGKIAPDFTLRPPKGGDPVTLSSFRGKKPVALIFGSYT